MSLKTFVIVIGAVVVLFVFGLAGTAYGGLSSGAGFVDDSAVCSAHPTSKPATNGATNPACVDVAANALVVAIGTTCSFELQGLGGPRSAHRLQAMA